MEPVCILTNYEKNKMENPDKSMGVFQRIMKKTRFKAEEQYEKRICGIKPNN
jgi:hypothetical protein